MKKPLRFRMALGTLVLSVILLFLEASARAQIAAPLQTTASSLGIKVQSASSSPADWNAGRDLKSNELAGAPQDLVDPNPAVPAWSYGYRLEADMATTNFNIFTADQHAVNGAGSPSLQGWIRSSANGPGVIVNIGTDPVVLSFCCGPLDGIVPGEIDLGPGGDGTAAVVRWTAPASGNYNVSTYWRDIDPHGGNGCTSAVVVDGKVVYIQTWPNGGSAGFTNSIAVTAGAKVDFVLGPNGEYSYDSTAFNAMITPAAGGGGTPAAPNMALAFAGGGSLSVANTDAVTAPFTVEFWGLPDANNGTEGIIGSRQPADGSFDIKFTGQSGLHGDIGDGGNWFTTSADYQFPVPATNWVHVAYVVTRDSYTIVVNGVAVLTNGLPGGLPLLYDANHQLRIGNSYGGEAMVGQLDEIRIWNRARSASEIAADYNKILRGTESGLVNYYRFSEGLGQTTADLAPAGGSSAASLPAPGSGVNWSATGPTLVGTVGEGTGTLPDLVLQSVQGPASVMPGQPVAIQYTVMNQGTAPATAPWQDGIYLSTDPQGTRNVPLDIFRITNSLAPGATLTFTQNVVVPVNGESGQRYFVVALDAGNALVESIETNNVLAAPAPVNIPGTLTVVLAGSEVPENAAAGSFGGTITRNGDFSAPLTVRLASSNAGRAPVPATVVIPAGQATADFAVNLKPDGLVTGPIAVTITASADNFQPGAVGLTVLDIDVPALSLVLTPAHIAEGSSTSATLSRQGSATQLLTVNLSGPLAKLNFPSTLTLAAGQANTTFTVASVDDLIPQATRTNVITAAADGFANGSAQLVVDDSDVPNLSIHLARPIISEGDGPQATTGTISRDRPSPRPLTVALTSSDVRSAQVPATVTIPAGSTNADFNIAAIDNTIVDGDRTVVIGAVLLEQGTDIRLAEAPPVLLKVTDDDGPSLRLQLDADVVAEGLNPAATGTVTRNGSTAASLAVTLVSSAPAHATVPATLVIPAGAAAASFPVASVTDSTVSGNQQVAITASAAGFASSSKAIVVTDASLPDLTVKSLSIPASVASDTGFKVTFRVENHGLAASGTNFIQRILLSADALPSSDDEILFEAPFPGSVPAGSFFEQTVQVHSPQIPGDYWIIVVTDADNRIPEILESNNSLASPAPLHVEKAYGATVAVDIQTAAPNTPVALHGQALLSPGKTPAAYVPVDIMIRLRDTERHIEALTDISGNYRATFQPLPGEGGSYSVAADYPGVTNSPVQAHFSLLGLSIDRVPGTVRLAENATVTLTNNVSNLADLPLSGLTAAVTAQPAGVTVTAALSRSSLEGDGIASLVMAITAAPQASSGTVTVRVTSTEGAATEASFQINVEVARARLAALPDAIEAGMRRGGQSSVQIVVTNSGTRATGPLTVLAPSAPWLKVSSGTQLPSLDPGAGTSVSLLLTPAADLELGPYTGNLIIKSDTTGVSVPFTFRNLSDKVGNLLIETVDEYTYYAAGSPKLTNAAVRIFDSVSKDLVLTNFTGLDGTLTLPDLREAYYDIEVSADGHSQFKKTVLVESGKDNRLTAFLSRQTVRYLFSVVPAEIEDRTRIVITTQFETFVPIPVLTVDPPYFDLSQWSGTVTQVNVTLMNHGLLAADNVRLALPGTDEVEFSSLISSIGTLPAQSSLTIPIVIRRVGAANLKVASQPGRVIPQGRGGSSCYSDASFSFDLVCGPQVNTYNVPLRFDKLPGCPERFLTVPIVEIPTFNYTGGGGGGGQNFLSCPDCFNTGLQQVFFNPPRDTSPPNNCNPCISGIAQVAVCIAMAEGPDVVADGVTCAMGVASCAAGLVSSHLTVGSATACLSAVGTCISKPIKHPLQMPACLRLAGACLQFGLSGGGGGTGKTASFLSKSAGLRVDDQTPSEAQPLIRQLQRALAFLAPLTNVFGSDLWLQQGSDQNWTNWFNAFSRAIDPAGPSAEQISDAELGELLALPAPADALRPDDIRAFVARWNRSLAYYQRGIFTLAQVPAGESTDFVATDVTAALAASASAANQAAIADGYSDPITAVVRASQDFIAKANSAGGGSCARVKLKIEQEAVITRDGFNATLEIANDTEDTLSNVSVELTMHSATGQDSTRLFLVRTPTLSGLSAVDGTGQIAAHSSGKASWILIPTSEAAPDGPVTHAVGGTLRYQQGGTLVTVPLVSSSINVLPNAALTLKYFHQRDVFADDPFTPEIEPSVPFSLAVLIQNTGKGTAKNVRISSAQPKITDNQKGLLIDFNIIATDVDGQPLSPSLTASFGDINPGQIKIGRWLLKSSLQGLFTDYSASFENIDGLGDKRVALIQNVEIHEMDHMVQADRTFEDGHPDFLANDVPDINNYPDTLYLSQGTNMPVTVVTNAVPDAPVSAGHLTVSLQAAMPAGWGYLRVAEPSAGQFRLKEVRRADGTIIALATNVWVTDRTLIGFSQKPVRENILHLLDFNGSGAYQLTYEPLGPLDTTAPVSAVSAIAPQSAASIPVSWSGADSGGSGIAYFDIYVSVNGGAFQPWLQKTTDSGALYPGEVGRTYAFYSVATDLAGNQEAPHASADAQTTVSVVNTAPILTVAADQTVDEGTTVILNNSAIDHDIPANTLSWSLGAGSPAGAQMNPATGLVTWTTGEATGPSTNHFTIIVQDNGQPSLSATGSVLVIVREVNTAPVLGVITNRVMNELQTLKFQAQATDADLPANNLAFSLVNPPRGAGITPSGFFTWTPDRTQGPSTNDIEVKVTDDGIPAKSASQHFTVVVRDTEGDFDLAVGSLAAQIGSDLAVPLSINSGLDLSTIACVIESSADRLREFTLEPLVPELAAATLVPESATRLQVQLQASPGQLLQGKRALANLTFKDGTNQHSAIVYLTPRGVRATRSDGQTVTQGRGIPGRIVLVGLEPLIAVKPGSAPVLELFGNPGQGYTIEQAPTLTPPVPWQALLRYQQTNIQQTLPVQNNAGSMFYELRQN